MMMMIMMTTKASEKMDMMTLKRIFKTIDEKSDDNDLINDNANPKFESNIKIDLLKRNSQSL